MTDSEKLDLLLTQMQEINLKVDKLVQHCANSSEYSTCYLHQSCVVVSQQCHRIASFLRLVLSQISGTVFHCYLGNAVLAAEQSETKKKVEKLALEQTRIQNELYKISRKIEDTYGVTPDALAATAEYRKWLETGTGTLI